MKNKKPKTASVSTRVELDLKTRFLEHLENENKCFSKWLRAAMIKELEKESKKEK